MVATGNAPQRLSPLTPLKDALGHIERWVQAAAPRQAEAAAALGRVLASAVVASAEPRPSTPIALRDGWALRSEVTLDASSYTPAALVQAPTAVQVGDPLPSDADAVAPFDGVGLIGSVPNALVTVAPGEGVLVRGADVGPGETLLKAGRRLSRTDLAVLAAIGQGHVSVRQPRVRVMSARPGTDAITEAIVTTICGAVRGEGGVAIRGRPAEASEVEDVPLTENDDAVIVVGGTGMGERDCSVGALIHCGHLAFHGVGLTPGETAAFGTVSSRPILIVPGRLDAALAAWLLLGRHMLARLTARDDDDLEPTWPLALARKITSTIGLAEVIVARRDGGSAVPLASGYLSLQALAQADGWIFVPADLEGIPADAMVVMKPLP
jgi:molybdopterin molybdotransferase